MTRPFFLCYSYCAQTGNLERWLASFQNCLIEFSHINRWLASQSPLEIASLCAIWIRQKKGLVIIYGPRVAVRYYGFLKSLQIINFWIAANTQSYGRLSFLTNLVLSVLCSFLVVYDYSIMLTVYCPILGTPKSGLHTVYPFLYYDI